MAPKQIFLVRHGETPANVARLWQGSGDDGLTDRGRDQARALGARLAGIGFSLVISSDLGRAVTTAALASGRDPELDPAWREMDLGRWENLSFAEVQERYAAEFEAILSDPDATYGGGETWTQLCARIGSAADAVIDRLGPGERALVVTHGGSIQAALTAAAGFTNGGAPWPVDYIRNTALSLIEVEADGWRQARVVNDARHALPFPEPEDDETVIALIRHGETEANRAGVWQGTSPGTLTERGLAQGAELAAWYDSVGHVYSSPLRRARMTADAFAGVHGLAVTEHPDLHEIAFGTWEGMSPAEIEQRFPDEWRATYVEGHDLVRGESGETYSGARDRLGRALDQIAAAHPGERVAVFSHGGVIRGFGGKTVGLGHADRRRLGLPANTSVAHFRVRPHRRTVLSDYNLGVI